MLNEQAKILRAQAALSELYAYRLSIYTRKIGSKSGLDRMVSIECQHYLRNLGTAINALHAIKDKTPSVNMKMLEDSFQEDNRIWEERKKRQG